LLVKLDVDPFISLATWLGVHSFARCTHPGRIRFPPPEARP